MVNRAEKRQIEREGKRLSQRLAQQGAVDLKSKPQPEVKTVAFGYQWDESRGVSGFWHQSILRLLQGLAGRVAFRPIAVEGTSPAKNQILRTFLNNEGDDYLLLMDTDVVFDAEDVALLLAADSPIAGATEYDAATGSAPRTTALVCDGEQPDGAAVDYVHWVAPEPPTPPVMPSLEGADEDTARILNEEFSAKVAAYAQALEEPEFGPQPVAAVGMGLTLIRRDVVEEVAKIYPFPFESADNMDPNLRFCLRAAEFGFGAVVVPKARIGHVMATVI
jgi:hypothetical protein